MTTTGTLQPVAVQFYGRFWRLAQQASRAADAPWAGDVTLGYKSALQMALRHAISSDMDSVVAYVRENRATCEQMLAKTPGDQWYQGCVAGCDKAMFILQGGIQ